MKLKSIEQLSGLEFPSWRPDFVLKKNKIWKSLDIFRFLYILLSQAFQTRSYIVQELIFFQGQEKDQWFFLMVKKIPKKFA